MLPALPTWVGSGIAERLADCGNRVIMPDTRGHGDSVPADETAYPPDALTSDALALIAHLGLTDYDLGGYSRVTVPALVIAGDQDGDRGSVEDLAATLARSTLRRVPGNHFTALYSPELPDHLVQFLGNASGTPGSGADCDTPGATSSAPPR